MSTNERYARYTRRLTAEDVCSDGVKWVSEAFSERRLSRTPEADNLVPPDREQVEAAKRFLAHYTAPTRATRQYRHDSYSFKHQAEGWSRRNGQPTYIS